MLQALIIVFREVVEAGLIIGIVLAATQGLAGRVRWIAAGVVGGLVGAGLVAAGADLLADAAAGAGQELFNAALLALAVIMLGWHNIWMARHGRVIAAEMQAAGAAVRAGERTLAALAIVVAITVLREGSEVVLFLYGIAVAGQEGAADLVTGGLIGVALGALVAALIGAGLVRLPVGRLFALTGGLISLLAAGMAAGSAGFLLAAGLDTGATGLDQTVWDASAVLPQSSLPGRVLHALIGYSDRPSRLELLAWGTTLITITLLTRLMRPQRLRVRPIDGIAGPARVG